jgi:protein tyrosine phosphatase type 4A
MVCLALIHAGMDNLEAVSFVRKARPGSINRKQLEFLRDFKVSKKSKCGIQ